MKHPRGNDWIVIALRTAASLLVWAVHFLFAYVLAALACARGWDGIAVAGLGLSRLLLFSSGLIALAACAALLWCALRRSRESSGAGWGSDRLAVALAILSMIAIAATSAVSLLPLQCEMAGQPLASGWR